MNFIRKFPATLILMVVNVVVFAITFFQVNTFSEPIWSFYLLDAGAEFAPLALDREWYRIITHMFLHGSIWHILFNMYALYSVGAEVENEVGVKKFLLIYFLCGIAASLVSMQWNLFQIGVGASGAIFGLFGFSLMVSLFQGRQQGHSLKPIIINFIFFLVVNIVLAKALRADTSAHLGGLACGILLALPIWWKEELIRSLKIGYAALILLVIIYFSLPRYQVTYYNFFQYMLAAEDSAKNIFAENRSDEYYLQAFKKSNARWDSALTMLRAHSYLPKELHQDTFKLRHYIQWRKKEDQFRIAMIERESYIYLDSIAVASDSLNQFMRLDYPLVYHVVEAPKPPSQKQESGLETVRVFYNEDWEVIHEPPFTYYRIGSRDSLGRWQGRLQDYYANGDVQMKGSYKDDERDGVFIYYSDHKTYQSAGRYRADRSVGKWETFHNNGTLESEVYYTDRYFLKNLWDSAGVQLVKDGFGKVTERFSNGVISAEGEYKDGYKEGYWYGRHSNGDMYFEESYYHGRLVSGRSRNVKGETFLYDESSFFPLPEGGYKKLKAYIMGEVKKNQLVANGIVKLSFRVTTKGSLTDFKVVKSVSKEADELAKKILKEGLPWIPAKDHGCETIDGYAYAEVDFKEK